MKVISPLRLLADAYLCSCRCSFYHYSFWRHRPCAMWKMAIGFYWQMKCVWSVLMHCHPPESWALQQHSLAAAAHSEAFYSLWISVKSLSSHTALCSPPLFSTLGGHFSSNSVKEGAQLNSTESVCFILDMHYLSSAIVNILNIPASLFPLKSCAQRPSPTPLRLLDPSRCNISLPSLFILLYLTSRGCTDIVIDCRTTQECESDSHLLCPCPILLCRKNILKKDGAESDSFGKQKTAQMRWNI